MKKIDKIPINIYCIKCKKKQTNYDLDFPLNVPNESFDKDSWSESEVHCQDGCDSQEFYVKKVIKIENKKPIKSILEELAFNPNKVLEGLNKFMDKEFENKDEFLRYTIESYYGKENVEWQVIHFKADAITAELGNDEFYYENDAFIIEKHLNFTINITYKGKEVFSVYNGVLNSFLKGDWIKKLSYLYDKLGLCF